MRVTNPMFESERFSRLVRDRQGRESRQSALAHGTPQPRWACAVLAAAASRRCRIRPRASGAQRRRVAHASGAEAVAKSHRRKQPQHLPPRVVEAQRFLAQRGWTPGHRDCPLAPRPCAASRFRGRRRAAAHGADARSKHRGQRTWQPLGPTAVHYARLRPGHRPRVRHCARSLRRDRQSSLLGTTGGGVWVAQQCRRRPHASSIVFTPLTDTVAALSGAIGRFHQHWRADGAAGRDRRDSGRHRRPQRCARFLLWRRHSALDRRRQHLEPDPADHDAEDGLGAQDISFVGEGFAGFAWSTVNPQLVVAAVSQAYEGTLVDADRCNLAAAYEGLYYSTDSGATWHLATITDGSGADVQGPLDPLRGAGRQCRHIGGVESGAAVVYGGGALSRLLPVGRRHHLDAHGRAARRRADHAAVPHQSGGTGSIACPIFRGTLAVNPQTGDTFAWTVDLNNQDQGLWQDQCAISGGACSEPHRHFCQAVEHGGSRDQYPRGRGDDRQRRLQPGSGRGSLRSRTRCCWPAPTTCGSAAWPWAARGATRPTPPPA